jgi:hypothetical protein
VRCPKPRLRVLPPAAAFVEQPPELHLRNELQGGTAGTACFVELARPPLPMIATAPAAVPKAV